MDAPLLLGAASALDLPLIAAKPVPPLTIIDTHTHFYDPSRPQGVPWPPKDDKLLYRTVLPKDYKALATPSPVAGTVVVEASLWFEDNRWILDLAEKDPFIVGFVGHLESVGTSDFTTQLRHLAMNPMFRGIRIGSARLKEGFKNRGFLDGLKQLAHHDLSVDLLGGPEVLMDAVRLAREISSLRIVIDHVANVRIDGKVPPADWMRGIEHAAKFSNVYCKVSGLVEGTGRADGTAPDDAQFYRPILDAIWNAFGENRLIYGSNWPVSERFAPPATVQRIPTDYFSSKSPRALEKLFAKNARHAYKWITRQPAAPAGGRKN